MHYVNCFNRLRFLAKVGTKLQKMRFLYNLRTVILDENIKTREMTSFFHLLFPLYMFVTFILVFQKSQNSFSCYLSFGLFWHVKYLNLDQNLPISTAHHTFLESKHPKAIKNLYHVLFKEGSQKRVSPHGLYVMIKLYLI